MWCGTNRNKLEVEIRRGENLRERQFYYAKPSAKVKHVAKPVYVLSDLWASSQVSACVCVCDTFVFVQACLLTTVTILSVCVCVNMYSTPDKSAEPPHKIYYLYSTFVIMEGIQKNLSRIHINLKQITTLSITIRAHT